MARPRTQVDTQLGQQQLRPTANPVDQFVQVNPNGGAAQLARALQQFAPAIAKTGFIVSDEKDTDARLQGQQLAERLSLQKKSYESAVKEGLIPRGANPFFYAGVKEQFGQVLARKMSSDIRARVNLDENMKTTTSIEEYDAFVKEQSDKWAEENIPAGQRDEFFDAGFQASALNSLASQREEFASQLMARVEKLGDEAWHATVSQLWKTITPDGANRAAVIGTIQDIADDMVKNQGRNGTQVMRTAAKALAGLATETLSLDPLEALKEIRGKEGALIDTSFGKELYAETRKQVVNEIRANRSAQKQEQEWDRDDRERRVIGEALQTLKTNPQADLSHFVTDNPDLNLGPTLTSLRNNLSGMAFDDDQHVVGSLTRRIWSVGVGETATTAKEITSYINHGITPSTAITLINQLEQKTRTARGAANDPIRDALTDPGYLDEKNNLRERVAGLLKPGMTDGAQRLVNAEAKLARDWVTYMDRNPISGPEDWTKARAWLNARAKSIGDSEVASLTVKIDERGNAFNEDGTENKNDKAPARPRITMQDAIRMGQEIKSGNVTRQTKDFMLRNDLTTAAAQKEITRALTYYNQQKGATK